MIVVIDNYDSFTYNLVDYIGKLGYRPVRVFRNDAIGLDALAELAPSQIVISPGPKTPHEAGISVALIRRFAATVPLLGVCLGHQAIGEAFGGKIVRARVPMHGKTSAVRYSADPLFDGLANPFEATRYHSLVVERASLPRELVPLATAEDDGELMALKHARHPTYGVQFHPESICTPVGLELIDRFFRLTASGAAG